MKAKITVTKPNGEILIISMRCDDECKNGHDTFSITADIYKKGTKVFSDRNWLSGGCQHEEIVNAKKSLAPLVALHLSDGDGVPMYAIENGYYYMTNSEYGIKVLAEHLRINLDEAQKLKNTIKSEEEFTQYVESCKPRWKQEAEAGKELINSYMLQNI